VKPSFALRPLLTFVLMLTSSVSLAETAAETRLDLGYDSNPYTLSGGVGEEGGMFMALDASAEATRETAGGGELALDAGVAARLFGSSMSDANEAQYFVRVGGETGGKRREHAFDWALRYRLRDSTYVSRATGDVATSGGAEIGDRYDSGIADLRGAWHLPGGRWGRVTLEGSAESKDYRKDYASLGLDRLDYTQFGVEPQYEYERGADTVQVKLPWAMRQYRDRRVSDVNGVAVAGTDLEYTYLGLDARYARELSAADEIGWTGGYETREDNGAGYGDRKRWQTGVDWTHKPAKGEKLSAGLEYSSRVFDRPVTGNPLINDETPEKKGYAVKVKYERPFPGVAVKDLALLGSARWESYDNSSDPIFEYDRYEVFAGVRKEF
jgi:hypothetical protein